MTSTSETAATDPSLDDLLNAHFTGRVVRKDLTKLVKEGANVPVYVLEYLLGNYCQSSNDRSVIEDGLFYREASSSPRTTCGRTRQKG